MAKIVQINQVGGPENLVLAEFEKTMPEANEIRFTVEAFALNRADLLYMHGNHYTKLVLPSRLGSEAVGIVDAIGEKVKKYKIGDRVASIPFHALNPNRNGVQGEFAIVPEDYVVISPKNLKPEQETAIWMQYLTAYFALKIVGKLKKNKSVLIIAGASSAGLGAIQMANVMGVNVIATTRSPNKIPVIKKAGANHVIVTKTGIPFDEKILEYTSNVGVDMVFDPVAGKFILNYINGLNWNAKILIYGMLDHAIEINVPILEMLSSKASIHPYSKFNH
ncbi:MAG: zinc-binding dehydrogenase, partial [Rhizobiales bacterium]|nr:zinc-binding dehydrogenase [Hyphomicrobiales bacterium]